MDTRYGQHYFKLVLYLKVRSLLIKHFQNYLCDDKELPSSYGFSGSVPSDESGTITEAPTIFRPILETDSYLE